MDKKQRLLTALITTSYKKTRYELADMRLSYEQLYRMHRPFCMIQVQHHKLPIAKINCCSFNEYFANSTNGACKFAHITSYSWKLLKQLLRLAGYRTLNEIMAAGLNCWPSNSGLWRCNRVICNSSSCRVACNDSFSSPFPKILWSSTQWKLWPAINQFISTPLASGAAILLYKYL